jgi:hypothetical protein
MRSSTPWGWSARLAGRSRRPGAGREAAQAGGGTIRGEGASKAHVKRWIDYLMPYVLDDADPLGTGDLTTHTLPLENAPRGYELFQKKQDGAIKVVLEP